LKTISRKENIRMNKLTGIQGTSVIGMIHVEALPGTPRSKKIFRDVVEKAKREAMIYLNAGVDAVMIENMHDAPYLNKNVGPEITASMTIIAREIRQILEGVPCGIQILAGANKEALAVAKVAQLNFIRAEGFVFAHVADEGVFESCAGELLRYRKQIEADHVLIFTDIKKKHSSHSITADTDISETAKAAEFFLSDGVIITGTSTGSEAEIEEIKHVKESVRSIPVLVGSGVTLDNVGDYCRVSDALIVGSYFKKNGFWENELDIERGERMMDKVNRYRVR